MKKRMIIEIFQKISLISGLLIIILFFVPMMIGIMPYIVLSGSMEPKIKTGSVAYVNSHVKAEEIVVGDIIGFSTKEGEVTHRVVEINKDGSFVTKGDNNDENDSSPVAVDKVKGKTIFSIPFLGRLVAMVKTKQGICLVCAYILLNALCIIFDKKIYDDELPSSFKEAIMKCESLDEIKAVIIEEMDDFKNQIIDDISSVNIEQLGKENTKQLSNKNKKIDKSKEKLEATGVKNKSSKTQNIQKGKVDELDNSKEIVNLLSRIDSVDEEIVDLNKVKKELARYDNPKLREIRDNLKSNMESAKIVKIDEIKKAEPKKKRSTTTKKKTKAIAKTDEVSVKPKQTRKRKSS